MFKFVHKTVWAFDVEWVPDPVAGKLLLGLEHSALGDQEIMERLWERGGSTEEEPRPFLKTVLCRIVSLAAVERRVRNDGAVGLRLLSLPRQPLDPEEQKEPGLIQSFLEAVGEWKPQLVGYNSRGADLPILVQRGVINGLSVPLFAERPNKPWEGPDYFTRGSDYNIDLMDILGVWGRGNPSLHELTTLSGIPGKFETGGEDVAELWLKGDLKHIVDYNERDAVSTYLLWLRLAHFGGFFDEGEYEVEQNRVRQMLREMGAESGKEHLLRYLTHWEDLQRSVQSLTGSN